MGGDALTPRSVSDGTPLMQCPTWAPHIERAIVPIDSATPSEPHRAGWRDRTTRRSGTSCWDPWCFQGSKANSPYEPQGHFSNDHDSAPQELASQGELGACGVAELRRKAMRLLWSRRISRISAGLAGDPRTKEVMFFLPTRQLERRGVQHQNPGRLAAVGMTTARLNTAGSREGSRSNRRADHPKQLIHRLLSEPTQRGAS